MRYLLILVIYMVLSSGAGCVSAAAQELNFGQSYSQQKEAKREYRRGKRNYRRNYRRPRVIVRPRAISKPVQTVFDQGKTLPVITFDWLEEKPRELYPWDTPIQIKTIEVYSSDVYNPMDKEAQEIKWKTYFFNGVGLILVFHLLLLVYGSYCFARSDGNIKPS